MSDYSELRRLAHEASETEMDWLDRDWLSGIMADDWADYVAAIEPQVVIDLIAENERLDRESQNLSSQLGACDRERRQLKAENEALRNDAKRRVPLYEEINRAAGELPSGWEIRLCIERDGGCVELFGPDGCEIVFPTNSERLDYTVCDAIDYAIEQEEFYGRKA